MNASNTIEDSARIIKAKFKEQVQTIFVDKLNFFWKTNTNKKHDLTFFWVLEPLMAALLKEANLLLNQAELNILKDDMHVEVSNQSNHHDYLLKQFIGLPFRLELVKYNYRVWCRVVEVNSGYVFNLAFQHNNSDLLAIAYGNNRDVYADQTQAFELYCERIGVDLDQVRKMMEILICYHKRDDYELFAVA